MMSLSDEFKTMVTRLTAKYEIQPVAEIFFPPFFKGGQPQEAEFMALRLTGGATGISYVLLPDEKENEYRLLQPSEYIGRNPREIALDFGNENPVKEMISLAAINAICQQVMREARYAVDSATDSLGLLSISAEDKLGMVGLFFPLIKTIKDVGADLVVIEKNANLIPKYPELPISLDPEKLNTCNKVLCTSTTILNNSLDEILGHCGPDAMISIIGPTAGYFPDPLFNRGVDAVGGRVVKDGELFFKKIRKQNRWGEATQKICFQKKNYKSILALQRYLG